MHPHTPAIIRKIDEQLLTDLQAFLFAADARVPFSKIRSCFPAVDLLALMAALADLEDRQVISLSVRHNAVFETKRVTHTLKPLS